MKKVGSIFVFILLLLAYKFANKSKDRERVREIPVTTTIEVERQEEEEPVVLNNENSKIKEVIEIAGSYKGVDYKFGGVDKNGMDCSGLVFTSFKKIGKQLPRTSKAMSLKGTKIDLEGIKRGDLVFFKIDRLEGRINHVGLVISTKNNKVEFIHSSTSKGVTVSSLEEEYWKDAYVVTKRIIN